MFRLALALLFALGCGGGEEVAERSAAEAGAPPHSTGAPNAAPELVAQLREDLATPRHASDGAGRAWLDGPTDPEPLRASGRATIALGFEAGPLGIAVGGRIAFQVPPFWGWSTPQSEQPDALGYTEVSTTALGVSLEARTTDAQRLELVVGGRALAPGESVRIVYGAGPAGARVDRFAERESAFVFAVDGDGDGVAGFLAERPTVEIAPGAPAQLAVVAPSVLRPGEEGVLRISLVDAAGNATEVDAPAEVVISYAHHLEGPSRAHIVPGAGGRVSVPFRALPGATEGAGQLLAGVGEILGEANPILVSSSAPKVLWADLHGHSNLSDGTGTPEDFYTYAREVAGLDVAALTDHDHWGFPFLDANPAAWRRIQAATLAAHAPGQFVTLLGYEWTSWIHGHRHVLHFEDAAPLRSSLDPAFDTPQELWAALRGEKALTFAHHSAGEPVATDWTVPPDPVLEPLTEIASVHGSSEAFDAPTPVRGMIRGNTVRDALRRGYRLGFVGSGDSHDGHPGLALPGAPVSGLAAILSAEPTRQSVLEALRERRSYATNGPRILLDVTLDGAAMGAEIPAGTPGRLRVRAAGTAPLQRVDLVTAQGVARQVDAGGEVTLALDVDLAPGRPGDFLYVRVIQEDGGAAWSSPFFFDDSGT